MLDARKETRIDVLQQACVLLQDQVSRQADILVQLSQKIAELEGRSLSQAELDFVLGPSGIAAAKPQAPPRPIKVKKPKTGHGPTAQPELPRREEVFELPESERVCGVCDGQLEEMGVTEDSEEITVVSRCFEIVLNRRKKYRCRCNASVVTAAGPAKLIPGGRYSPDFAVEVAVAKYADHLPLERQATAMARQGLEVTSATLFDQIAALGDVLAPSYEALRARLLDGPVLHVDETGWLLAENGKRLGRKRHRKQLYTATVWGLCSERYAYYALLDSKSTEAGRSLLASYTGTVVADGYQVYEILARPDPGEGTTGYQLANCWAHVLRKFRDLEGHEPRSHMVLGWIRELYEIDREVEGPFPGSAAACAERLALRQSKSKAVLEQIRTWAFEQGGLRQGDFGKAVAYMIKRWDNLTRFLDDARIPLDNNRVERALRKPVMGRKNHFCSRSERGAKTSAILYSLIETARLAERDPAAYLREAVAAALASPGTVTLP